MELQRCLFYLLLQLSFFLLMFAANLAAANGVAAGGWNEIPDVLNNTHIQDLGKFAVIGFNNLTGSELSFYAVFEAQAQIVAGLNFGLVIQALDSDLPKMYKAYVWEKPWEGFKNLTSFEPVLS